MSDETTRLAVEERFDWEIFVERYWERRPVLFETLPGTPFDEQEVFEAAVLGTRRTHALAVAPNAQFTVERWQQTVPGQHFPETTDLGFDGYQERMARQLGGRRYALVVHKFHAFHRKQWAREVEFYAGLWERVGLPLTGAITTLFHGTYEHSPVGVHKDRFATFMFGLRGSKRMRFWLDKPWSEEVSTVLDYRAYLPDSFTAEVSPGQLLYWPSSYFHVGESANDEPATSVNVGVPRERHQISYEVDDLLLGNDLIERADTAAVAPLPPVTASLYARDQAAAGDLPDALVQGVEVLRELCTKDRLAERLADLARRHRDSRGFPPAPPVADRLSHVVG